MSDILKTTTAHDSFQETKLELQKNNKTTFLDTPTGVALAVGVAADEWRSISSVQVPWSVRTPDKAG
jgi:hypothetical protein